LNIANFDWHAFRSIFLACLHCTAWMSRRWMRSGEAWNGDQHDWLETDFRSASGSERLL
jgi:hypothetical protein